MITAALTNIFHLRNHFIDINNKTKGTLFHERGKGKYQLLKKDFDSLGPLGLGLPIWVSLSVYPWSGYPRSGYPRSGYPRSGYPRSGYPQARDPMALI